MDSLANHFLIAMPGMGDPNFAETVTLVCEHNAAGALGVVVNRPLDMSLGEVFTQLQLDTNDAELARQPILKGGPVQLDRGFVVHTPSGTWDSTLMVSDELHVTTSQDVLVALAAGRGPERVLVTLGYAGWGAGQLEQEMAANTWLSVPAEPALLFDTPFEERLARAAELLGVDLGQLTAYSGHA